MINETLIKENIKTKLIGRRVFCLDGIDSTNSEAYRMIESGMASAGDVIIAKSQSAGRGQQGHEWSSPKGNVYMSIITCSRVAESSPLVTFAAGIACADAIRQLYGLDARLKWVNDILVDNKKLGGILTESSTRGAVSTNITGIGINANSVISGVQAKYKPVSLKELVDAEIDVNLLIASVCNNFEKAFNLYQQKPVSTVLQWLNYSDTIGKQVKFEWHSQEKCGIIKAINYKGFLEIESEGVVYTVMTSRNLEIDYFSA